MRITANTGSGAISKNWVAFRAIREVLEGRSSGRAHFGPHAESLCGAIGEQRGVPACGADERRARASFDVQAASLRVRG